MQVSPTATPMRLSSPSPRSQSRTKVKWWRRPGTALFTTATYTRTFLTHSHVTSTVLVRFNASYCMHRGHICSFASTVLNQHFLASYVLASRAYPSALASSRLLAYHILVRLIFIGGNKTILNILFKTLLAALG